MLIEHNFKDSEHQRYSLKKRHRIQGASHIMYSISLQDIYAGQCLQALLSTGHCFNMGGKPVFDPSFIEVANQYASAMFRSRRLARLAPECGNSQSQQPVQSDNTPSTYRGSNK
jgi:hypothetical protein